MPWRRTIFTNRSRVLGIVVVLVAALTLAGCTSRQVQVAAGTVDTGPWAAWVFRDLTGEGICLELRPANRQSEKVCGLTGDNLGSWWPDAPAGTQAFVGGTTGDLAATSARVTLQDGGVVRGAVAGATDLTDVRFFVVPLPPGASATKIDLLDDSGAVLLTLPHGQ